MQDDECNALPEASQKTVVEPWAEKMRSSGSKGRNRKKDKKEEKKGRKEGKKGKNGNKGQNDSKNIGKTHFHFFSFGAVGFP